MSEIGQVEASRTVAFNLPNSVTLYYIVPHVVVTFNYKIIFIAIL